MVEANLTAIEETPNETEGRRERPPFLSPTQIWRYLLCPEQYRLYYLEGFRPKFPSASLVFGQAVHEALAGLFKHGDDPVGIFLDAWKGAKEAELSYGARDSWEKFNEAGPKLLLRFTEEELPKLSDIAAVEERFEFEVTGFEVPFVGVIDLVASLEGKHSVVDFKTSGTSYPEHEAQMSDQLTAYQLAEPTAEQAAFCVFVRTKDPRIEWQVARRSGEQLTEYLSKAGLVSQDLTIGRFYKRPGKWCLWCDFLPVCLGDQKRVEETLVKLTEHQLSQRVAGALALL